MIPSQKPAWIPEICVLLFNMLNWTRTQIPSQSLNYSFAISELKVSLLTHSGARHFNTISSCYKSHI